MLVFSTNSSPHGRDLGQLLSQTAPLQLGRRMGSDQAVWNGSSMSLHQFHTAARDSAVSLRRVDGSLWMLRIARSDQNEPLGPGIGCTAASQAMVSAPSATVRKMGFVS